MFSKSETYGLCGIFRLDIVARQSRVQVSLKIVFTIRNIAREINLLLAIAHIKWLGILRRVFPIFPSLFDSSTIL